ncbi:Tautomerase [Moelleriella libera RCEF 2490]|uniref:Tautomerase n=1 Tax=Moelleriella libera RCEF 2490 TaxID=1081109 RepID=A0A167ZEL1_9HYPO|nr:Tautomerase [Moelleriella libera RCEF 2490]
MPLWQVFYQDGAFEDAASKTALAQDATKMYEAIGLPAFYVVVQFIKLARDDLYIGGKQNSGNPFIRIVINHVAYVIPEENDAMFAATVKHINAVLLPHVYVRGYDSEVHVGETDRRLWQINGMNPPKFDSEEQKLWAEKNRPVWYDGA